MNEIIQPAMQMVSAELAKQNTPSHIEDRADDRVRFEVDLGNELNFVYEARLRSYIQPAFALAGLSDEQQDEEHRYYRAEIYLKEGGRITM